MVRVQTVNKDKLQQMEMLGHFLTRHHVPLPLAERVRRQVRERSMMKMPLTIDDLPSLSQLPLALRQELACSIFGNVLLSHTVFYTWCLSDDHLLHALSFQALELEVFKRNDDVFAP